MLSVLRQKLNYQPQDGFVCLVAESVSNPDNIAGVVDVSLQSGKVRLHTHHNQWKWHVNTKHLDACDCEKCLRSLSSGRCNSKAWRSWCMRTWPAWL